MSNALPQTNISLSDIRDTLQTATNDIAALCKHFDVNKWAKYKPINCPGLTESDVLAGAFWPQGLQDDNFYRQWGLNLRPYGNYPDFTPEQQGWGYDKPQGGDNSPYRLGDFRGYYHDAICPFDVVFPEKIYWKIANTFNARFLTFNPGGLAATDIADSAYSAMRLGLAICILNAAGGNKTGTYCCTTYGEWDNSSIILNFRGANQQNPLSGWSISYGEKLRIVPFLTIYFDAMEGGQNGRSNGRIGTFDPETGRLTELTYSTNIASSGQGVGTVCWPVQLYRDYAYEEIDTETESLSYYEIKSVTPMFVQNETPAGNVQSVTLTVSVYHNTTGAANYPGAMRFSIKSFHGYQNNPVQFTHQGNGSYLANIRESLFYKDTLNNAVPISDEELEQTGGGRMTYITSPDANGSAPISLIPSYITF